MCECDGEDCCKRFAKFLLVVINLIFFLLGLLMLAFGIAMVAAPDKVAAAVEDTGANLSILGNAQYAIKGSGIFMIVLGGIVALIGSFGFFGACCENKVLLVLYLILVIIILLAEVALIIFAACFPSAFRVAIQSEMYKTMITNFTEDISLYPTTTFGGSNSPFGYSWAITQADGKCCGVLGPNDYNSSRYSMNQKYVSVPSTYPNISYYPLSCCVMSGQLSNNTKDTNFADLRNCMTDTTVNSPPYYTVGCYERIDSMIKQASRIAIGIAAAIVGFEIIIIILGFILCCQLRKYKSAAI